MSVAAATADGVSEVHPTVKHRGLITVSVMLASVMQVLDNTIANVALPHIQGSLSSTQDQMSWVLTSYIVAAAIMTPLSGWLAGRFGRRRVFLFSIFGFTLASAFCGLANSLPEIVTARLLQGISGAALVPMAQATLLDINPPERHARAMTTWVMGITLGPILGPALGGWLTEAYTWRWVFYINVPIGILSFLGVMSFLKETPQKISRFDFMGFASLALAIGSFQLMLDRGQGNDWFNDPETWIEAGIAALSMYTFIVHILTTKHAPFVSLRLFRDRNFLTGCIFIFIVGVVLFATLALLPPMLQGLLNYPIVLTGLVTAPRGIGTLLAMVLVSVLAGRVDQRYMVVAGLLITALALWQMTGFYLQMGPGMVIWSGVLQGIGTGLAFVPLSTIAFSTLAPQLRNEGTAMFSLMRNIGSSIGISVVVMMWVRNTQIMHSRLAEHITPFSDGLTPLNEALASPMGLAGINASVTQQAAMLAYNNDFKLMLVLTLCAVPLTLLLRSSKGARNEQAAAVIE
ncbi:DHA2 family efflux MFS transporter permease subunit [Povalibacter sp.]|uniref:DHA2 family efflux MFS transporter permease subunit n=1 Tax=Povalibacter sp. TaxID=1962978 RepID=UPI002F3EB49D